MRLIVLFIFLSCVSSCNMEYNLKQMEKHRNKAIIKGVEIKNDIDTVNILSSDTITLTFERNDTVFQIKEVIKTVTLQNDPVYITKYDRKLSYKLHRQNIKLKERANRLLQRLNNKKQITVYKQDQKTIRKEIRKTKWWMWLLIGTSIGLLLPLIKKFIKII